MPPSDTNEMRDPSGDHAGDVWLPSSPSVRTLARPPSSCRTKIRKPFGVSAEYATSFPSGEIAGSPSRSDVAATCAVDATVNGLGADDERASQTPTITNAIAAAPDAIHGANRLPRLPASRDVGARPPLGVVTIESSTAISSSAR